MTICIVSSSGGHLLKTYLLKEWWQTHQRFWITKKDSFSVDLLKNESVSYGYFPENRDFFNFWKNLFLAYKILKERKPDLLFSTGAGIAPPFFIVAKILGIKTIFMETFILTPRATLSGKMIYPLADSFLVQNKKLLEIYPKAYFWGSVI